MGAKLEEFIGYRGGHAKAAGRVLRIDHDQLDRVALDNMAQVFANDPPSSTAKHITYKKNLQTLTLLLDPWKELPLP
jgi:hypothetical protein